MPAFGRCSARAAERAFRDRADRGRRVGSPRARAESAQCSEAVRRRARMSERFGPWRAALLAAGVALLIGAAALFIGPALEGERALFVLLELRLPRVLAGALVGATLSLVGAVFQGL